MPFLSVVIPTYNRKETLLRALEALARQTLSPDEFEVIVVSDGSTDGTAEAVRERTYPYAFQFVEQQNAGPSAARNRGADLARGDVCVYIDDDIEPVPEFLAEHARLHREDPDLVAVGPQSPPDEPCACWVEWEHRMLERQYERFRSGEWELTGYNLYSGNFSAPRARLLEAGGFDVRYVRQEDVELGMRLAALGMKFRFASRAVGLHRPTRPFRSWYETPYTYGKRDVQIAREKGHLRVIELARQHYSQRSPVTRALAALCVGRRGLEAGLLAALRAGILASDALDVRQAALGFCSILFNLRYLQGMCEELGGRRRMWRVLQGDAGDVLAELER